MWPKGSENARSVNAVISNIVNFVKIFFFFCCDPTNVIILIYFVKCSKDYSTV